MAEWERFLVFVMQGNYMKKCQRGGIAGGMLGVTKVKAADETLGIVMPNVVRNLPFACAGGTADSWVGMTSLICGMRGQRLHWPAGRRRYWATA